MKKRYLFLIACFLLAFAACKKADGVANGKPLITGKWNILNDSLHVGVGVSNDAKVYVGRSGDYFDFRDDGYIYIKEGAELDTLSFSILSDTKIVISEFGVPKAQGEISTISNFTTHSIDITTPTVNTPGGTFGRAVKLRR